MAADVGSFLREAGARIDLARGAPTLLLAVAEDGQRIDDVRRGIVALFTAEGHRARDLGAARPDSGPSLWVEGSRDGGANLTVVSFASGSVLASSTFARIVNAQREVLRSLAMPLILLVDRRAESALRESAPDFFTWVAHVFEAPTAEALESAASARGVTVGGPARAPRVEEQPIRFLHLSDLHLRPSPTRQYDQQRVLGGLIAMLLRDRATSPLDLIFVTGDLANSGVDAEYKVVVAFLNDLLAATGVAPERLFVVPGNHDVDRAAGRWLLRTLASDGDATDFFVDPQNRRWHAQKFEAWRRNLGSLLGPHRALGLAVGADAIEYADVRGTRIAIASFNSAWFAQGDDDRERLWIGEANVAGAARVARRAPLSFALMHHPIDDLSATERTSVENHLERSFDVVLRGHLHHERARVVTGPRGTNLSIAAPAGYQGSQWPNGCYLGEVMPARRAVRLRPFMFGRGEDPWVLDARVFPDDADEGYAHTFRLGDRKPVSASEDALSAHAAEAFWALDRRDRLSIARRLGLEGAPSQVLEERAAELLRVSPDGLEVWRAFDEKADSSGRAAPLQQVAGELASEVVRRMGLTPISRSDPDFLARSLEALERVWRELMATKAMPTFRSESLVVPLIAAVLGEVVEGPVSTEVALLNQDRIDVLIGRVDDALPRRAVVEVKVSPFQTRARRRRDALGTLVRYLGPDTATRGALIFLLRTAVGENEAIERALSPEGYEILVLTLPLGDAPP